MSKYTDNRATLDRLFNSVSMIDTDKVMEIISTAVENAVKTALSEDSLMPYYSPALHECRKAKVFDVDVIANLYAKEQGFKP